MPLALTLGLLAGLLNFIPNFGPLIAAIPAVLIAFLQSPQQAQYVALLYAVVQMIDGYVLTPLVDGRSVELPPALTISTQLLLGLLFGFVGLLVVSPLTATVMLLVKMLYVEDVLGDPIMRESVVGERDAKAQRMEPRSESKREGRWDVMRAALRRTLPGRASGLPVLTTNVMRRRRPANTRVVQRAVQAPPYIRPVPAGWSRDRPN